MYVCIDLISQLLSSILFQNCELLLVTEHKYINISSHTYNIEEIAEPGASEIVELAGAGEDDYSDLRVAQDT